MSQENGQVFVPDLTSVEVTSTEEVWTVMQTGASGRATGSTDCNERSSRSHSIVCVTITGENTSSGATYFSKLTLVDLAGSERASKSNATGDRLKEAQNINKSLSALGNVISALGAKNSHIPYRDSKLTYLLKDSLGGNSKTLMFIQISPSSQNEGETLCSLHFGARVKHVELGVAKQNVDTHLLKYKEEMKKAEGEKKERDDCIAALKEKLKQAEERAQRMESLYNQMCDRAMKKDIELQQLQSKLDKKVIVDTPRERKQLIIDTPRERKQLIIDTPRERKQLIIDTPREKKQIIIDTPRERKQTEVTKKEVSSIVKNTHLTPERNEQRSHMDTSKDCDELITTWKTHVKEYLQQPKAINKENEASVDDRVHEEKKKVTFADSPVKPKVKRRHEEIGITASPFMKPAQRTPIRTRSRAAVSVTAAQNSPFVDRNSTWSKSLRGGDSQTNVRKPPLRLVNTPVKTTPAKRMKLTD